MKLTQMLLLLLLVLLHLLLSSSLLLLLLLLLLLNILHRRLCESSTVNRCLISSLAAGARPGVSPIVLASLSMLILMRSRNPTTERHQ